MQLFHAIASVFPDHSSPPVMGEQGRSTSGIKKTTLSVLLTE